MSFFADKPRVSLRLGKSLDPDNLKTGNDVYFECDVKANPIPHKLVWLHKGKQLVQNHDKGIVMSTQSLVLQKVERESSGEYECQAFNSEGYSTSNAVRLNIMYAPVCSGGDATQKILGISYKKPATILCEVQAHPSAVSFRWFFNNSEHQEWKDHGDFTQSGLKSQIEFLPKTSKDYGNLYCIAENTIGVQEEPCSFQIVPTGKPSPLTGCQIINRTLYSLKVECHEGFDGGLPANFLMELYYKEKMELKFHVTNKVPIFEVSNIEPGVPIKLYLYAENAKGTSDPAIIDDSSQNPHQHNVEGITDYKAVIKKDSSTSESPPTSYSLILVTSSMAGLFILSVITLCIVFTYRRKRMIYSQSPQNQNDSFYQQQQQNNQDHQYYGSNPDLIPIKNFSGGEPSLSIDGQHQPQSLCSELDSALLLGNQRVSGPGPGANVANVGNNGTSKRQSQHVPIPVPHLPSAAASILSSRFSDNVSLVSNQSGFVGEPIDSVQTGTLDRNRRSGSGPHYPLYHTCNRQNNKKKVTILENDGHIEDGSKV